MSAFFNNLKERGMVNEFLIRTDKPSPVAASGPVMLLPEEKVEQQLLMLDAEIWEVREKLEHITAKAQASNEFQQFVESPLPNSPQPDLTFPFESLRPHQVENAVLHRSQNKAPINQMVDNNPRSLGMWESRGSRRKDRKRFAITWRSRCGLPKSRRDV